MPQLTSVTLKDREVTPTNHTFTPVDIKSGVGYLVNGNGVPIGDETLTISSRKTGNRRKAKMVLMVPVVQTQTIAGISTPVVVRRAYLDITASFDVTSTTQERKNLMGMGEDGMKAIQPMINAIFVDLQSAY